MDLHTSHHRLHIREQLTLSTLWFSLNSQSAALLPIVIPTQILLFVAPGQIGSAKQATFLAWLSTMGALLSLLVPPLVGMMSDHTSSAFGRRRPYIMAGTFFLLLSALLLAEPASVVIFVLGTLLMRSAGCAVNDYADRDFDPHVKRTRSRPLRIRARAPAAARVHMASGLAGRRHGNRGACGPR